MAIPKHILRLIEYEKEFTATARHGSAKVFPNAPVPKWVDETPQTPLEVALRGKLYHHDILCSGDRRFPIGTYGKGCSCLGRIAKPPKGPK